MSIGLHRTKLEAISRQPFGMVNLLLSDPVLALKPTFGRGVGVRFLLQCRQESSNAIDMASRPILGRNILWGNILERRAWCEESKEVGR